MLAFEPLVLPALEYFLVIKGQLFVLAQNWFAELGVFWGHNF